MIGEKRPLAFEEVQQVRHLLQIGRDVGIIANEVCVIELYVDYMFDAATGRIQRARILRKRNAAQRE